jgi:hypothetical protein
VHSIALLSRSPRLSRAGAAGLSDRARLGGAGGHARLGAVRRPARS